MVSRHNFPFAGKLHYHIRIYITLSHIKVCELTSLKEGHISLIPQWTSNYWHLSSRVQSQRLWTIQLWWSVLLGTFPLPIKCYIPVVQYYMNLHGGHQRMMKRPTEIEMINYLGEMNWTRQVILDSEVISEWIKLSVCALSKVALQNMHILSCWLKHSYSIIYEAFFLFFFF